MVPRRQSSIRTVAIDAFLEHARIARSIGTKVTEGNKEGTYVYSPADNKKCMDGHWLIKYGMGCQCFNAAIHAALSKLEVLAMFWVAGTPQQGKHYRLRFGLYARIKSVVYRELRTNAGWSNFSDGGGNMDEAPRKVWAQFMVPLDDIMPKNADVVNWVLLTNGDDPKPAAVEELDGDRLARFASSIDVASG